MTYAIGNDVASWQIYFDPDKASGPVDFSIMKMTEGTTEYIYPEILAGWQKTSIRGGYHYQLGSLNWQAQADKFMQVADRYDTHFLAVDLEDAGNTVNAVMYQATQKIIDYLRAKQSRPVLLYTNKNHYQLMQAVVGEAWMDGVLFWYANPTGTPGVMPLPTGRTTWTIHQYSWKGTPARWGTGNNTDENVYNGTPEQMRAWLKVEVPTGYSKSRQYNSDIYTVVLPKWQRAHVTNTNGVRETVSSAARRLKATYAVNGDGWTTNAPLSLAASDGNVYNPVQYDFRPFVNILSANTPIISHIPTTPYNLVSGTRYLLREGVNQFANSTDPEHIIERHPRTSIGYTKTNALILCVVDGRRVGSAGVTVKELADLMKQAGAWYALEMDGGGSSALWVKDKIVNVPSDGTERPVINHLLIYEGATMANGTAKEKLGNTSSIRAEASRYGVKVGTVAAGSTIEFMEIVSPILTSARPLDLAGDRWFKMANGNFVNYTLSGVEYYTILTQPTPDTPPDPVVETVDVQLPAGAVVIFKDATGKEIARYTA